MSLFGKRIAGIATIATVGVLLFLGVTRPNPFATEHGYWAVFDSAQGLGQIDRDVRVAGVKVGTIGDVERTGDDVRVELILFDDYVIHRDARVAMRPHTLFEGSNFVDLAPGSPGAPVLGEGEEIPMAQTSNYVTLDEALRVLRPEIRSSLRDLAQVGSRTLRGKAITGTQRTLKAGPELTRSLGPAARAAQGPGRRELAGAVAGLADTVDAVAQRERDLVPLVRGANRTVAGLTVDAAVPLDAALAELPATLRELEATAPTLTSLIDRLDGLATQVNPALPELALAVSEATPVLERSIPVLERATPLIRDARLIARRLAKSKRGLLKMFGLLPGPLALFDEALKVMNEPTVHGAPAYRQLVAGGFAGLDGSFRGYQTPSQAMKTNGQAPGHALRISTYLAPDFFTSLATVPCASVEPISADAADLLESLGLCS